MLRFLVIAAVMVGLSPPALAGGASATMQVSITVQASCTISSVQQARSGVTVECGNATPYRTEVSTSPAAPQSSANVQQTRQGQVLTIVF